MRGPGPPGSMFLFGAHLNWGPFKYYCRGGHLNWLAKIKLRGPGPWINIIFGGHLNVILGGHLNWLEQIKLRVPGPWISIIVDYCYACNVVRCTAARKDAK